MASEPCKYIASSPPIQQSSLTCYKPQSPKDDLESLAYVLIYLFRGYLPWTFDDGSIHESYLSERTVKLKLSLPIEIICKDMPSEFARHLKYARSLKYEDTPNYGKVRDMYRRLMKRMGYQYDGVYDWDLKDRKVDVIKQPSGATIPASKRDKLSEQEKPVPQSDSLIPETPLVQNKSLEQASPSLKETPLKRKNPEGDKGSDQENKPEEITQPTKKRRILFNKAADKQPAAKNRQGRSPKAQPKQTITNNAQQDAEITTKAAENNETPDKKAAPRKKPAPQKKACK